MGGGNEIHLYTENDGKLQLPGQHGAGGHRCGVLEPVWQDGPDYTQPESGRLSFKVWPNYTEYGYDCYQNEGKVFGTFYNPYCDNGEGELRFVFMRPGTNEIVEQFQPIDIKTNGAWDGKRIQCYVTSAPGTYQLVPLFRKKGETMWCRAVGYSYGSTDEEWLYEVKAPASDDLPALRMMEVEGQGYTSILAYPVPP